MTKDNARTFGSELLLLFLVLGTAQDAKSAWPLDPHANLPICTAAGDQQFPQVTPDGQGGALICWTDWRFGYPQLRAYAQRVSNAGVTLWPTNGVALSTRSGEHTFPIGTSDGTGGGIFCWEGPGVDQFPDLYAQRIDASGAVSWGINGIVVASAAYGQFPDAIISDDAGGAMVAWTDGRTGAFELYMQRLSSQGQTLWASNGVAITHASVGQAVFCSMISDGAGGAILAWEDSRNYFGDIYVQRINSMGVPLWTSNGVALTSLFQQQGNPSLVTDGAGGAIVTWEDQRGGESDIYAGRVDANGAVVWGIDGVPVCTAGNLQVSPQIVSDDAGGVIIAWMDDRNADITSADIYSQRLTSTGVPLWASNGVPVCTFSNAQVRPVLVPDSNHGAIIVWGDQRMGANGLYAQGVDASGLPRWTPNGVLVSVSPFDTANTRIASDDAGGAIIVWADGRHPSNSDVYASRLSPPVANAGGPYIGLSGRPLSFNGLGSLDFGGDPLNYIWDFGDGTTGSGPQPVHVYATSGQYTVRLTVSDTLLWDSASTTVTISHPIDCSHATAAPAMLWPPNHQFVPVTIAGITEADDHPVSINITRVTQNEPGSNDVMLLPDGLLALRAERKGNGKGRVYTIWFTAISQSGSSCEGSVQVHVPRAASDLKAPLGRAK